MKNKNDWLERLVEADGGGAVEDDVDVVGQRFLVVSAQAQLRLSQVAVHRHDLLCKVWLLRLQPLKQLGGESQSQSDVTATVRYLKSRGYLKKKKSVDDPKNCS